MALALRGRKPQVGLVVRIDACTGSDGLAAILGHEEMGMWIVVQLHEVAIGREEGAELQPVVGAQQLIEWLLLQI